MGNIHTFDLGDIKKLLGGLPQDLMQRFGNIIIETQTRRIRSHSITRDGDNIDPNSVGWAEVKATDGKSEFPIYPLVHTGQMLRHNSWIIKSTTGEVIVSLSSEHHEKLDNIDDIASQKGLNWLEAFGIGKKEVRAIMKQLDKWLMEQIGVQPAGKAFR
jgi:hypothetical protein